MPFGPVFSPSIGLSLLKAGLTRAGHSSSIRYFTIPFAERVGQAFYSGVASYGRPPNRRLAGEWIFAHALHDEPPGDPTGYVDEVLRGASTSRGASSDRPVTPALLRRVRKAQQAVDAFLADCLQEVLAARPRVVGFTSVFQQHVASLALARRIKRAAPDVFVVLGGANCEDVMGAETVRRYPFVDAAVSGEADLVFPELVRRVLAGRGVDDLAGVHTPSNVGEAFATSRFRSAPMVADMDALPHPDYADYFEQYGRSRYRDSWQPSLFFETSRGCWWGEKQHCTFCGLNGTTMAYRSKSAPRALEELAQLTAAWPGCDVQVTDNILDMRYFKDFVPGLAERGLGASLLYETKSNLTRAHLRALGAAGIRRIQPGVESLSDAVLGLMRKGVSAAQNVQLLKWCRELGLTPYWNILWGFPGEPPAEYAQLARLAPLLAHLPPPGTFGDIRLDRFSPNFFEAEARGLVDVRPLAPYRHLHRGVPEEAVHNLAYYFSFTYREPQEVAGYVKGAARALRRWQRARDAELFAIDVAGALVVCDTRPGAERPFHHLPEEEAALLRAADIAAGTSRLAELTSMDVDVAEQRLAGLAERGLVARLGTRWLSLPIAPGAYRPAAVALQHLLRQARRGRAADVHAVLSTLKGGRHAGQEEADPETQAKAKAKAKAQAEAEEGSLVRGTLVS